jgi:hypothetical protein
MDGWVWHRRRYFNHATDSFRPGAIETAADFPSSISHFGFFALSAANRGRAR